MKFKMHFEASASCPCQITNTILTNFTVTIFGSKTLEKKQSINDLCFNSAAQIQKLGVVLKTDFSNFFQSFKSYSL